MSQTTTATVLLTLLTACVTPAPGHAPDSSASDARADRGAHAAPAPSGTARPASSPAVARADAHPSALNTPTPSAPPAEPAAEARAATEASARDAAEKPLGNPDEKAAAPTAVAQEKAATNPAAPPGPSEFDTKLEAARSRLAAALVAAGSALVAGDLDKVVEGLRASCPDSEHDASQAQALGDALFALAPDLARAAHARALALAPKEHLVLEASGRELHRAGKFVDAAQAYQAALDAHHPAALLLHGLRADCLLRAGQIGDALLEWQLASPLQSRSDLERALAAIHGTDDRDRRRADMIARVRKGDLAPIEELLLVDTSWKAGGDYPISNREYTASDMALAAEKLGKDSRRYIELEFLVQGRLGMEPRPKDAPPLPDAGPGETDAMGLAPSAVEKSARKLGFMGFGSKNKHLPVSSTLAIPIYRMVFLDGDVVATEWIGWFGDELVARATSAAGDIDAAVLLLDLYDEAITRKFEGYDKLPPKRTEFEAVAWAKYKDPRIASRVLSRRANEIHVGDPILKEALATMSGDLKVASLALDVARRELQPLAEPLLRRALAALAHEDVSEAQRALQEYQQVRAQTETPPKSGH